MTRSFLRISALAAVAIAALAAVAIAATSAGTVAPALQSNPAPVAPPTAYAPDHVIVAFDAGVSATARARVRAQVDTRSHKALSSRATDTEVLTIGATDVPTAVATLKKNPNVRFAEPDWIVTASAESNDRYVTGGSTWGLYGSDTSPLNVFGSAAMASWSAGRDGSRSIAVGIIDTGINILHPDLSNNIWRNPVDNTVNGLDEDGNGFTDDVNGWDFHNNNNTVYDSATADAHGTHVAGTIGALGSNSIGVAGVNWDVTMIPAKFLGPNGGFISNAVKAADYLTALKVKYNFDPNDDPTIGVNIVATNNSWGGGGFSQAMLDAINRGGNAGILFVAAAGNGGSDGRGDNNDTTVTYPSNYQCTTVSRVWDCVVAVAAIRSDGALATFSNYGAETVDLGAPGQAIYSTLPGNSYGSYSGTSMATPHVTGSIALCRASYPGMAPDDTRVALLASRTVTESLTGKTVTTGVITGGRLNADAFAISCAQQQGGTPLNLTQDTDPLTPPGIFSKTSPANNATGINRNAALSWAPPRAPLAASYEVCIDTVNDNVCAGNWTPFGENVTGVTARLAARTTYYWQVLAINPDGATAANAADSPIIWWKLTTR